MIDKDRVEASNVNTQIFTLADIGAKKVDALKNHAFRAVGIEIEAVGKELTAANSKQLLKAQSLLVDCFDNSASRHFVQDVSRARNIPCLHVGLNDRYAEICWEPNYQVPKDPPEGDACDYPLTRNIVLLAVAVAAEEVLAFCLGDKCRSWSITLNDRAIRQIG